MKLSLMGILINVILKEISYLIISNNKLPSEMVNNQLI